MKRHKFLAISFIATFLISCNSNEHHKSQNSDFSIEIGPHLKSLRLIVRLFDDKNTLLDELDTKASGVMKWSMNWYNDSTIVLHSHDIGTYVWKINQKNKLMKSPLSDELNMSSIKAFNEKYHLDEHSPTACLAPVNEFEKRAGY